MANPDQTPRKLSGSVVRLFEDQVEWLARMKAERSAEPATLVRSALDYYKPVYEALTAGVNPELQALVTEAAGEVGDRIVIDNLKSLIERKRALDRAILAPDEDDNE
jgi:hypothetical protein